MMRVLSRQMIAAAIAASSTAAIADDDFTYARRLYLDKAQCSYCHGWAGDGAGEGQSNGGAANLRQTRLNRSQITMVILCGRPGTAMPHFDESAYTDKRCYDVTEKELGSRVPSLPPGSTLQPREAEAIADYVVAKFAGRGAITRTECEESFGKDARRCSDLKP
jgi:mono/diheme cytochrome c family protein